MSAQSMSSGVMRAGAVGLVVTVAAVLAATFLAGPGGAPAPADVAAGPMGPEARYARVPGDGLPPRAPSSWFHVQRAYPLGAIPRDRWRLAQRQAAALRAAARPGGAEWTQRGPTNVGGRMTDIAVHPQNADIVYAAAAEGGVLRSADAGATWTPLFDDQPSLSMGAIAIDPNDPTVIYAGTGEVNPGGGSVAYGGAGLFRSTDEGATWQNIGLEETGAIGRIRIDPTDSDRIFVAAMGILWGTNAERGVYRTTDGGDTWERVLFLDERTGCVDLIMRPDDTDVLYAAMWERIRQPEYYDYGGVGCSVRRSTDGGETWALVGGGLPAPNTDDGRIGLSLCESQPDVMHAIYADRTGFFDGLYRSTDGGFTWTQTNDGSLSGVYASYGWWFGNVRTHPADPDTIFILGFNFARSTNGGASYHGADGGMHVDHHGLDFGPGPEYVMYEGNDGGVYRSTNGGTAWSKLFDLPVTQAYRIALDENDPAVLFLGSQDNSTDRSLDGTPDGFDVVYGGDGFQPLVSPANSNHVWALYQYGGLGFSSNRGSSFGGATGGVTGRSNWNSPLAQDPTDPNRRYFGTSRLHRSNTNTTWTVISPDLTGGPHLGNSGQVNGTLTTIGVSPLDGDVIWTGSDDGYVYVTDDGGGVWTNVSAGLPERWITSVRADPFDRETAYATISGFRWGEPLPHVYRTTDLGVTWVAIDGNLPEAPVNEILADPDRPDRYFVASDVGMYETWDGGATWSVLGTGLPNVVVTSLALDRPNQLLYAGTYGRSVFTIGIAGAPCPWDLDGSGSVDFGDIVILLGAWGNNPGHPADFDDNGVVDFADLLQILNEWGPCP